MTKNLKIADEVFLELREHVFKLLEQKEVTFGMVAAALMTIAARSSGRTLLRAPP